MRTPKAAALATLLLCASSPLAMATYGQCHMVAGRDVTLPHALSVASPDQWYVCSPGTHTISVRAANQEHKPSRGWVDYQVAWIPAPPCTHATSTWGFVPQTASPRYGRETRHLLSDPPGVVVRVYERQCSGSGGAAGHGGHGGHSGHGGR